MTEIMMDHMDKSEKLSSAISSKTFTTTNSTISLSESNLSSDFVSEVGKKRKKLSNDERLNRNRERNRIHARKTRERKKFQTTAIQNRIHELYEEGRKLRQVIDERYTASSLLGLSQSPGTKLESDNKVPIIPSTSICENYYETLVAENNWIKDSNGNPYFQATETPKRVRRSGKLNPQEREKIRRERNRMHAKKTRDRKKFFLEMSDKIISEMETESQALRDYMRNIGIISDEEYQMHTLKHLQARQEIDSLKQSQMLEDGGSDVEDEDEEDNGETASENENPEREERSPSGSSDENEKVSSWSRSSASSNPDSSGTQSMESHYNSLKSHSSSNAGTAKMSEATTNDNKSSNSSRNSFNDKLGDNNSGSDERDSPQYNQNGSIMNDNEWNEGDEFRERDDPSSDRSSEAPESYHHGRKRTVKLLDPVMLPNASPMKDVKGKERSNSGSKSV